MGVSVRGNVDPHLRSPCPQCGYATRYKQWPVTCACFDYKQQLVRGSCSPCPHVAEIWAEQGQRNATLHLIDHGRLPPLKIAAEYAMGRRRRIAKGGSTGK